jgi:class 3 adenylate cyclase
MEEIADVYNSKAFTASMLCARGGLELAEGNPREAIQALRKSARLWRESDLPYETARARLMLGLAYRADGDEDSATLEIGAAKAAFEKLGAVLDLRRARDLLGEEIGEGVPKTAVPAERVTKTFMFTDIVGSTNLAAALGEQAWGNVLAWHDDALRKLVTSHYGEVVKQLGDGFFVAFDDATEAVECAVDIQQHLADHAKSAGFAPPVRIGLHAAEATRKDRDYEGMGVHEAARIGALGEGGEIVASEGVISAARLRWPVGELRAVELKGLSAPVKVASIDPSES